VRWFEGGTEVKIRCPSELGEGGFDGWEENALAGGGLDEMACLRQEGFQDPPLVKAKVKGREKGFARHGSVRKRKMICIC